MTKQQKIMLGILGVGAIAYYIWRKNRPKAVLVSSRPSQPSDFERKAVLLGTSTPTLSEKEKMTLFGVSNPRQPSDFEGKAVLTGTSTPTLSEKEKMTLFGVSNPRQLIMT
jgi:hypothetical protein